MRLNAYALFPELYRQRREPCLQIIDRHVGSVVFLQPQHAHRSRLGLQVMRIGGAARIDDPDISIALDTLNMGMSTHSVPAKICRICAGSAGIASGICVSEMRPMFISPCSLL